jgi:hypothetical protein
VGTAAAAKPLASLTLAELAGVHKAGRITRIDSVFLERKPEIRSDGTLPPLIINWDKQPEDQAEQKPRSLFEAAQWPVAEDGTMRFSAQGVDPQQECTPLVMVGKVTAIGQMASASVSYQRKTVWDTQIGSLDARLVKAETGNVTASVTVNVFTQTERLKAVFEQSLP